MKRNIIRNTVTAAALLLSGVLSINALAQQPFTIQGGGSYATLQEAVDNAVSGQTIEVLPCSEFSLTEYDAITYSTNNESYYQSGWGGEVYIKGKSLIIKSKDSSNPTPMKDFVFVIAGATSLCDISLNSLKLTGKSKILVYSGNSGEGINSLNIKNCDIDVDGGIPNNNTGQRVRSSTIRGSYSIANWTNGSSIVFCGTPAGNLGTFLFEGNTMLNHDAGRYICGRSFAKNIEVRNNVIGSESVRFTDHFMTCEDTSYPVEKYSYKIHNNTFYSNEFVTLLFFTTGSYGSNAQSNEVLVYDNQVNTLPAGRMAHDSSQKTGIVWCTKLADIHNGSVTVTNYNNTVNNYCYNYINTNSSGYEGYVTLKAQPGHSWDYGEPDARIQDVPIVSTKVEDVFYHNVASVYNAETGEFEEYDLGTKKYCAHCDALITPSVLNIEVTGLAKGESEVFGVYSIGEGNVETLVLNIAVTGKGSGTDVSTIIKLADGSYKVKPTTWDWAYTNSPSAQSVTVSDGTTSTAEFTLAAKSGQPTHSEKARVNQFK